jgi:hypothetical protein
MPGMCLTVVAVAAMSAVGGGSATATVKEAATVAVEEVVEVDDGLLDPTLSLMMKFGGDGGVL